MLNFLKSWLFPELPVYVYYNSKLNMIFESHLTPEERAGILPGMSKSLKSYELYLGEL